MPRWSDDEIENLRQMYATTPNKVIADKLDRDVSAIKSKAYSEGLSKNRRKSRMYETRNAEPNYPNPDSDFANWLCGFVDGEGSFCIVEYDGKTNFRFTIGVAESDSEILKEIKSFFGVGGIYHNETSNDNWENGVQYTVSNADSLARTIIPFFDNATLRAKKSEQYREFRDNFVDYYDLTETLK